MSDREGRQNRWQDGCLVLLKIASGILLVASLIYLAVAGINYAVLGAVFYEGEKMGTLVTIVYALALFAFSLAAGLLGMRATYTPSKIVSFCIAAIVMVIGVLAGMTSDNFGYPDSAFGSGIMGGLSLFFGVIALVSAGIGVFVVKPEVLGFSSATARTSAPAADADGEADDEGLDDTGELVNPDVEAEDGDEGAPADVGSLDDAGEDAGPTDVADEDEPPFQPAPEPRPRGDVGSTPLPKVARTAMPHPDEDAPGEEDAPDGAASAPDDGGGTPDGADEAAEVPAADDAIDLGPITSFTWEDDEPEDAPESDGPHDGAEGAPENGADEDDRDASLDDRPAVIDAGVGEIEWVDFGAGRDDLDDPDDEGPTGFFGKHRRR